MVDAWAVVGGKREVLSPPGHWSRKKPGPFSHGLKVGDMIFVGAQRPLDRNGDLLGIGDIEVQTDEAFRNLNTMLEAGGGANTSLMRQNTYFRFFGEGPRRHRVLGEDDQRPPPLHVVAVGGRRRAPHDRLCRPATN